MANTNIKVGANMTSFDKAMENSANKAEKSFEEIVASVRTSGASVKKELRQLTNAMSSMLASGVDPANAEYQKLARRAGELEDAIADAREEIKAQANDTRNMTLAFGAVTDGLNAFQAAQSAMSLFGIESDDATKAIQRMMAAQTLLNSVQAIGNSLTSKSTLLGKAYNTIKGLIATSAGAQAATEGTAAAATAGLATAETGATVATTALSTALNSLPLVGIVSAIGAAAVGLIALAKSLFETSEAEKAAEDAAKSLDEATSKGSESYQDARLELDKYLILINNFVGSQRDEKKMVDELNKKYGEYLGTYQNIHQWKNAIIDQGESYCDMLEQEAKAQALSAKMGELYAKSVTGELDAKSYYTQALKLRQAWEDTIVTLASYKNLLRQPDPPEKPKKKASSGGHKNNKEDKKSITETLHTMEDVNRVMGELTAKMNAETDLNKKLDLSQQLKQVKTFKKDIEALEKKIAPSNHDIDPMSWFGMPKPKEVKRSLEEISKSIEEYTKEQAELLMKNREAMAAYKDSMSGDVGAIVTDFTMLARMFNDEGISATDAAAGLVALGEALQKIGGEGAVAKAGAVLAAIGQIILGFAQASAQASSMGPWGWLAFVGAGLGAVAATIATVKGFNTGGIVTGAGATDTVPAMLTPGEAVLTRHDQARLWRMLKNGGDVSGTPELRLRIAGSDLVGTLRNYNNIYGKVD